MVQSEAMDPAQAFMAAMMARNKSMDEAIEHGDSAVQQFSSGAVVFVTGGSGFLGKQLIEKLLRATKIKKVFVLLRPKKEKSIEERFKVLLQEPVFDKIREQQPGFAEKIIPVAGDVAELRLGMSDHDWNTLADQVNIIFHIPATTRMDCPLRMTTMINVRGTREALLLGKSCKNLKSYVHVSTAFSHACSNRINMEVSEDFYKSPLEPETLIQLAESVADSRFDISPGLIKNWPNNYSFSKAVAEEIVKTMSDDLPICVVRPAVVISSIREPQPGWIDVSNLNGPSGLLLGIGKGLIHTMLFNDKTRLSFIPVDYVNNATLAAGWATAKRWAAGEMNPNIYTVTTTPRNPLIWGKLLPTICRDEILANYPTPTAVAYSLYCKTSNPLIFWIHTWLLHLIPAYIIDGVCLLVGKERRFVKLYTRIYKLMTTVSFFSCNNFDFANKNTEALYDSLSEIDREIFDFDVNKIDWREFMILWVLSVRKYILKDGLTRTEYAKKKQAFLRIFTYAAFSFYFFSLYKLVSLLFFLFRTMGKRLRSGLLKKIFFSFI